MKNVNHQPTEETKAESAKVEKNDRDINDVFDDIVLSEEKVAEEGYQKGFEDGESSGNTDGYHLGYHRGAELGAELGYYFGVLMDYTKTRKVPSEKATKAIESCLEMIDTFPRTNDDQVDILQMADNIRAQYRKACALLKISGKYPEADQLNFWIYCMCIVIIDE